MTPAPQTFTRHRRLRQSAALRDLVREHHLHVHDLVAPLFVTDSPALVGEIAALPGVRRHHVDEVADIVAELARLGIRGVLLFGVPREKDDAASGAWALNAVTVCAIRSIRAAKIDIAVFADVCLCQYTSHGHCDVHPHGPAANDETLQLLCRTSVAYAEAGAHMVAPSGMMDGAVLAIRQALDDNGFSSVGILSYAVKHASALYGPFRDAALSAPAHGDRRSHQLDPANAREALREARTDVDEGADIIMVKPATTNLDTLVRLRLDLPHTPLAAYEVSGEYAMVRAAGERSWIDVKAVVLEKLTAIKRAGADVIVTYSAPDVARWLAEATERDLSVEMRFEA